MMWKVPFKEYLKFNGVKKSIREVKKQKKKELAERNQSYSYGVEESMMRIAGDIPGFEVKEMPPQMDVGFGADMLVSYKEEGKNYSFFADVTTNPNKYYTSYLTASGETTKDLKEAFCYRTEYFSVRFGLKKQHSSYFVYEKPVVVLLIDNYTPTTGVGMHHIHVIGSLLKNLNALLMKEGYGARASHLVRPNPKKYYNEYLESK